MNEKRLQHQNDRDVKVILHRFKTAIIKILQQEFTNISVPNGQVESLSKDIKIIKNKE